MELTVFKLLKFKIKLLMDKAYKEFEIFKPDILLEDQQSLSEFDFEGSIYYTLRHTGGSICILDSYGNLIAGDLFANIKKLSLALNVQNFSSSCVENISKTWRNL